MLKKCLFVAILPLLITACQEGGPAASGGSDAAVESDEARLRILTTTGMIADGVRQMFGDQVEVDALMGPGVDPHLYEPTQSDIAKLQEADVILYNGLRLEGQMESIFTKMAENRPVFALGDGLERGLLRPSDEYENAFDPHVWFNVHLWMTGMMYLASEISDVDTTLDLMQAFGPEGYIEQLKKLDREVAAEVAALPEGSMLITTHDAFGYFGGQYGLEVRGLQGISTADEISIKDVTGMTSLIIERKIPAIFVESASSSRNITAIIEGCAEKGYELGLGGTLYADALGEAGSGADTYEGMIRTNLNTITSALGK